MSILEVNNVSKSFGGVKANVDISMSVEIGSFVGLFGPNGSGKTTLFKAIIGTAAISAGTIEKDPSLKIGYVPQQINIDRTLPLTVERFLSLLKNKD